MGGKKVEITKQDIESLEDLPIIDRKEVDIENQDVEDEFLEEAIVKNIRGFLYFESKPVLLEKFKYAKCGFGLIMEFSPDVDLTGSEYEKTKDLIMKECKSVCDKRATEMYEEHNEGRTEF